MFDFFFVTLQNYNGVICVASIVLDEFNINQ